jgi:hypothetical protein
VRHEIARIATVIRERDIEARLVASLAAEQGTEDGTENGS